MRVCVCACVRARENRVRRDTCYSNGIPARGGFVGDCSCYCPLYSLYVVVGAGRNGTLKNGGKWKGMDFTSTLLISR